MCLFKCLFVSPFFFSSTFLLHYNIVQHCATKLFSISYFLHSLLIQKLKQINKKLEVALITTDQLHNEFDKIKELIKNELLKEINQSQQKELFNRMELAKYLKVSKQTIVNWTIRGVLNPKYVGNRVYYKADEVYKLLDK